jgi:tetratricopeptide (TPR) repeat protein
MILYIILVLINADTPVKQKYQKASQMRDPLKAVEYYRQIVKEDPQSIYADSSLFRIGMLYYILGDFEKTIDHFELIFRKGERTPLYKKTCYWLKFCYQNVGDSTKAKRMEGILKRILSADEKQNEEMVEEKPKEQIAEKTEVGYYTIQLGAYEDQKWLDYFLEKLKENNVEYFIRESGEYSRICSGKFGTRNDAEKYLEEIKNKGFHGFITFDTNP